MADFKPSINLTSMEGENVFAVGGAWGRILKSVGMGDKAKEMYNRATKCQSYQDAFAVFREYVEDSGAEE